MSKSDDMFNEQLAKLAGQLNKKPKSEFDEQLSALKSTLAKKAPPKKKVNGGGYEYVNDPETGKMRTRAQVEWEKLHPGRKVEDHQCVIFRNGNKNDFSPDNLVLSYKKGVPLDALTCKHCGARGQWDTNIDLV